jgi:hypothetical protein
MLVSVPYRKAICVFALAVVPLVVDAAPFALDVKICNIEIPFELPPKRFPVGCEIIDCCPGCPGPGPLEIRFDFDAPAGSETRLSVEGVPAAALKALKLSGNAKWVDDSALVIAPGQSSISGWPSDAKEVPVFTPRVRFADTAVKQLALADARSREATAVLSVTQLHGRFLVREFSVRYTIRVCPSLAPPSDSIRLSNNIGSDQAVALLDARRSTGCVNDEVGRGTVNIDKGSVLSNLACRSEVAVFSDDNAVAFRIGVTAWNASLGNVLPVPLQALVREAVTYWILEGPFATTQARVNADAARANQLYNQMNGGIGFNTTAVNNATADTDTPDLLDADCGNAQALRDDIGFTNGQLNVYYNRDPNARGWWCGNDTIIVGAGADNESLSHEFGHAFTLGHTNSVSGIPTTNLMRTGGTGRNMITIGQLFRTSIDGASRINVHGLRPGGVTRSCPDGTTSDACPDLALDVIPR